MTAQSSSGNNIMASKPTPRKRQSMSNSASQLVDREDKENIKRNVQKGFDIAYPESIPYNPPEARSQPATQAERDAWRNPKHPTNSKLQPISFHPILPDLEAGTDTGGFYRFKFDKPPLPHINHTRDNRIDAATFYPVPDHALEEDWQARHDAWEADKEHYDNPGPQPYKLALHLPRQGVDMDAIRKHVYAGDPAGDNPDLIEAIYDSNADGFRGIPLDRERIYPNVEQKEMKSHRLMALGVYDPKTHKSGAPISEQKAAQGLAAYYYPVAESVRLKVDRKIINDKGADDDLEFPNIIFAAPTEWNAEQKYRRNFFRGNNDRDFAHEFEKLEATYLEENRLAMEAEQKELNESHDDAMEGLETNGAHATKVNGINGHADSGKSAEAVGENSAGGEEVDMDQH
jgi:RNA polymerase II-associated factor 1